MNAPLSADNFLLVSRNAARERVRDALRLHVGRGRRYGVKEPVSYTHLTLPTNREAALSRRALSR